MYITYMWMRTYDGEGEEERMSSATRSTRSLIKQLDDIAWSPRALFCVCRFWRIYGQGRVRREGFYRWGLALFSDSGMCVCGAGGAFLLILWILIEHLANIACIVGIAMRISIDWYNSSIIECQMLYNSWGPTLGSQDQLNFQLVSKNGKSIMSSLYNDNESTNFQKFFTLQNKSVTFVFVFIVQ